MSEISDKLKEEDFGVFSVRLNEGYELQWFLFEYKGVSFTLRAEKMVGKPEEEMNDEAELYLQRAD